MPGPRFPPPCKQAAEEAGARVYAGGAVTQVHGRGAVQAVDVVTPLFSTTVECDLLAMSGGWTPTIPLTSHLGGKPVWDDTLAAFVPGALPPGMSVAGAAAGRFTLGECLTTGGAAGHAAAQEAGFSGSAAAPPAAGPESAASAPLWRVQQRQRKSLRRLPERRHRQGSRTRRARGVSLHRARSSATPRWAWRPTRARPPASTAVGIMGELRGRTIAQTGTTTFRPPYTPVAMGALGGHHTGKAFRPTRRTAAHGWAAENGASFVESGVWLRAQWFTAPGETDWLQSCTREVKAVRSTVGICDVSTLGKIDIQGPDAARLLDRLYTNTFSTLPVGRARYGLMLREDGFVFDDGTTSRLGDEHYLDDHHHGQCRQGDAAHRVRHAVAVAGARRADRLRHRAMGPVRRRGAEIARVAAASSIAEDISNAAFPSWRRATSPLPAACMAASSASPFRASSPTRSACPPAMATRWRAH